ncbi:MAG: aminopeptidase P N-terminal domain-containing protein [Planctomycetota bacterium]
MRSQPDTALDAELTRSRRNAVLARLSGAPLILRSAPQVLRNGDVHFSYRQDSSFQYLTGFSEPEAILLAVPEGRASHRTILFVRKRDPLREVWDGKRAGVAGARRRFGADEAYASDDFWSVLEKESENWASLAFSLGVDPSFDRSLFELFAKRLTGRPRRNRGLPSFIDPRPAIHAQRQIKSKEEIALLEEAARISAEGHKVAMAIARPGMREYEVQAEMEAIFRREGSPRNGYDSIVAGGSNACTLHYVANNNRIKKGQLLLIDAGAEYGQYSADVTRTFPVAGRFSEVQRRVYRVVLRTQKKCIRAIKPGVTIKRLDLLAKRELTKGLVELGVLRGRLDTLMKRKAFSRWYMHGFGHWLGMDVHDCGAYENGQGSSVRLKPGMVLTVEPGLYFQANDRKVRKELRGIGVRIEDDILVTRTGHRNLTENLEKEIDDIELLTNG